MSTRDAVYRIVSRIPRGRVMTYGDVAKRAGTGARAVGRYLHDNPDPKTIPCHRVVDADGHVASSFAFGGSFGQTVRLRKDGVTVTQGRVDLDRFRWSRS